MAQKSLYNKKDLVVPPEYSEDPQTPLQGPLRKVMPLSQKNEVIWFIYDCNVNVVKRKAPPKCLMGAEDKVGSAWYFSSNVGL